MKSKTSKYLATIAICLIMVFALVACSGGSYAAVNMVNNDSENSFSMTYDSFDGYRFKTMDFNKGEILDVDIDVYTESGEMEVKIISDNDEILFSVVNPSEHVNTQIEFPEKGTYRIFIVGKHSGSINIFWNKLSTSVE